MWLQAVGLCFPELGQGASFAEPTVSFSVSSGQMLCENQFKCHFPWGASLYPLPAHLSPLSCMHHSHVCAPEGCAHISHWLPACCLAPPAHMEISLSPPHSDSEGQAEALSLATANFFLSHCHFLRLRHIGSEQLAAQSERFLVWMTPV